MWVSSGLLTDSQDDRASPWDVVAIVLQVVGPMDRLTVYLAVGGANVIPLARVLPMKILSLPWSLAVLVRWSSAALVSIGRR